MRDSATLRFLLAFTSVWTVGILTLNAVGPANQINAMEKFSVFAQLAKRALGRAPAHPTGEVSLPVPDVDMAAVASIPAMPKSDQIGHHTTPVKQVRLSDIQLVYVTGEMVIVKTQSGIVEAKVGDTIPGAGKFIELKREKRAWVVITEKGTISDSSE